MEGVDDKADVVVVGVTVVVGITPNPGSGGGASGEVLTIERPHIVACVGHDQRIGHVDDPPFRGGLEERIIHQTAVGIHEFDDTEPIVRGHLKGDGRAARRGGQGEVSAAGGFDGGFGVGTRGELQGRPTGPGGDEAVPIVAIDVAVTVEVEVGVGRQDGSDVDIGEAVDKGGQVGPIDAAVAVVVPERV